MADRNIFQRLFGLGKTDDSEALMKSVEDLSEVEDENVLTTLVKEARSQNIDPMDHSNAYMMQSYEGSDKKYYFEQASTSKINNQVLSQLANHQIISAIIGSRINQVAEFAIPTDDEDLGYKIVLKDRSAEITEADKENIDSIKRFLENCGTHITDYELTFESFLRQIVRDSLIYDQCCFEIVKNRKGQITGFLPVDARTIKRATLSKEEVERGRIEKDGVRYIQVLNNKVVAEFKQDELCFGIRRPRTDIRGKGYGNPELMELYSVLQNLFNAETYNASNFTNGINANGIIAIKSKMNPKLFRSFRREFYQMLNGVANAKRTPLIQLDPDENENIQSVNLGSSNKEMEYNDWINYLIKVTCSIYQMDPAEIGFVFGTEAQSSSLFGTDPSARVLMGKEKGLRPLIRSLQVWINRYIVNQIDDRYELVFQGLDSISINDKIRLEEHKMKYQTINEIRISHDLPELDDGDIIAAHYGNLKAAVLRSEGALVAEAYGDDEGKAELEEAVEEAHEKELEVKGEDVPREEEPEILEENAIAKKKDKVDFDGDGKEHPAQYFEGLDPATARAREKEMERRQRIFEETGEMVYGPYPGDEVIDKGPQNKGTKSKKADEVREEIKKPGKKEFIRAASKVSGVSKKIIEEVYDKGLAAAASSGHRPGQNPQSWARARVYAFLFDSKSGARKADKHLWEKHLEDSKKMAKSETYIAPPSVQAAAERGIKAIEEHNSDAGTQVGRVRARQLANGDPISLETVKRMKAFFDRHEKNKEIPDDKEWYEDNGYVSWLLWGGNPGRKWAEQIISEIEKD